MNNKVSESCSGCYYQDYYAGEYYCCLSEPDIDLDGFCNSYVTIDEFEDKYDCSGTILVLNCISFPGVITPEQL